MKKIEAIIRPEKLDVVKDAPAIVNREHAQILHGLKFLDEKFGRRALPGFFALQLLHRRAAQPEAGPVLF